MAYADGLISADPVEAEAISSTFFGEGDGEGEGDGQSEAHGARAEIEMLSRGLGASVEDGATPPAAPKANPTPHRAAGNA